MNAALITIALASWWLAAFSLHAQDHIPLVQLPVVAPDSYPRNATLAEVHKWLHKEYLRIAELRDEGPQPVPPRWSAGTCHTLSYGATSEALPYHEWRALAQRTNTDLASPDVEVRRAAVYMASTLQEVSGRPSLNGLVSTEQLVALAACVHDPDATIRGHAAGLIAYDLTAFDPVPTLLAAIDDPDTPARRQIVQALTTIGLGIQTAGRNRFSPHTEAVVEALLGVADDPDRMTRLIAIHAIGYAGDSAIPVIPKLIEWLDSPDDMHARGAAWALAELGPLAAISVPTLAEHLQSPDARKKMAALSALRPMKDAAIPAVPAIAELLSDPDLTTTDIATWTLVSIGQGAKAAIPQLQALAARSDAQYQRSTNEAIAIIRGERALDDSPPRLPNPTIR